MTRTLGARLLVALGLGAAACDPQRGDDDDDTGTGEGIPCPTFEDVEVETLATTYTVKSGAVPVAGARVYVSAPDGEIRAEGTTAGDGTSTVEVADGDMITIDPYPDMPDLPVHLQSVADVGAGAPLTFYVPYPQVQYGLLAEMPELRVTVPNPEWSGGAYVSAAGPCLIDASEGNVHATVRLYWIPECVEVAVAGGLTHAPLLLEVVEPVVDGRVAFMVVDDVELGSTTALNLSGPWSEGVTESMTPTSPDFGYESVVISWEAVVGPIDGVRLGWRAYDLYDVVRSVDGLAPVSFDRVPIESEAAMLSFGLPEVWYSVFTRVPASAYGAPIAVDNVRTLTGETAATYHFDRRCLAWAGSPPADFLNTWFSSEEVENWEVMLPPSGAVTLPALRGITELYGLSSYWETDLSGRDGYLDAGDDSTLVRPPLSRQTRYVDLADD